MVRLLTHGYFRQRLSQRSEGILPVFAETEDNPVGGRLLLLVPNTSYRISDFLAAARRVDMQVAVASNHQPVLARNTEGRTLALDFHRPDDAIARIKAYHERYPLAAVVSTDEATTLLANRALAVLGLPHNAIEAVKAAGSKLLFRRTLAAAGVAGPAFCLISEAMDPTAIATRQSYPCVLKPLALAGSRGVIRADDPTEFVAAVTRIRKILADPETPGPREILVEEYLPGPEVALEGLMDGGTLRVLAIFDKPDPLEGPFFEETLYVTPSRHSPALQRSIEQATQQAVQALGLTDGPIHSELRLTPSGTIVIELAARSIGGLCARTLRFGVGLSLEDLILRHALGLPIVTTAREAQAAGVMMVPIPRGGKLTAVDGITEAEAVNGIEAVTISIGPGQRVVPLPEGNRYLGFIFARAETPEAVEAALRDAHALLRFAIEE